MSRKQEPQEAVVESQHETGAARRLSRHLIRVQGGAYLPAAARIAYFNEMYPGWRLVTTVLHADWQQRVFAVRAEIYDEQGNLVRTGHSMEVAGRVSDPLEKAETSAIARALGYLNIGTFSALSETNGERIADAPLDEQTHAPIPSVSQHPTLVRLARELSVPIRNTDRNEAILHRIHETVCPKSSDGQPEWSVESLRTILRNREMMKRLVSEYKTSGPLNASKIESILASGGG